jgi:hypothetical protein
MSISAPVIALAAIIISIALAGLIAGRRNRS